MNIKIDFDNIKVKETTNDFTVKLLMLKGEKGEQGDVNLSQLNQEKNARENADKTLQNQINGLASGSPLVASSTSGMTDTTRVYVNTTDGYWYYYDGSSWVSGGIYQASAGYDEINEKIRKLQDANNWYYYFENKQITSDGTISDSNIRLLSDFVTFPLGSTITVAEGYEIRTIGYDANNQTHTAFNWATTNTINDAYVKYRFNIRRTDNGNITPEEMKGKITTEIEIDKVFLKNAAKQDLIGLEGAIDTNTESINSINNYLIDFINLYNYNRATLNKYLDSDGDLITSELWFVTDYIDISNENYDYLYQGITDIGTNPRSCYYDENKTFISSFQLTASNDEIPLIIPQNAKYIRCSVKYVDRKNFTIGYYCYKQFVLKNEVKLYNRFSLNNVLTGKENMIWSWWYYPQVVSFERVRNKVYWGYTTHDGYTGIAEYDINTQKIIKNNLKLSDVDDHNGLALLVLEDGTIICAYAGGHNTDKFIHIRISETPESIERFKDEIVLESSDYTSYGQMFLYNGTIYLFYRVGNTKWAYRYSSDNGYTWSNEVILITSSLQYYCKFQKTNTAGLLRMCMYSNPGSTDSNIRQGFINLTNGNIYNSDNETLLGTNNVIHTNFDIIIPVETDKTQRLFDVAITDADRPLILYAPFSNFNDSVYKLYDTGNIMIITNGGEALWHNKYQDGASFIGTDKIVSINGFDGKDNVKIYNYNNGVVTLLSEVYSETKGDIPIRNARPIVDINGKCYLWHRGYYNIGDYTDFNTDAEIRFIN